MRLAVDSNKATAETSSKSHARRPARRTRRPGGNTAARCDDKLHEREKQYRYCMSVDPLLRRGGVAEKREIGGIRAISEAVDSLVSKFRAMERFVDSNEWAASA